MKTRFILLSFFALRSLVPAVSAQTPSSSMTEWPTYGNDPGGMRYSPLHQINARDVSGLEPAWTFRTGELETYAGTEALKKAAFEATPIMIAGTLYFSTPSCRVFALDAATGKQRWIFDPGVNMHEDYSEITSRGVSAWPAPDPRKPGKPPLRIFLATIDGRLMAIEAKTGQAIPSFGKEGSVDLKEGLGHDISETSPPAIVGDLVVVGSSLGDNYRMDYPYGTVRAYSALTGKLVWSWQPIPLDPADKAWSTWNGPKAHKTGGANAWSIISADPARDMVFIPGTSPSPDYYGGERLGQNLYGNSLVALRASTGKMIWYFQVVHHDLWDYDIPAEPMLIDLVRDGKTIPAVAVGTKMGHIFIFNRVTGKPLFPIEERKVPVSHVAGEQASETQPFPVLPEPLGLRSIGVQDAWGPTEKDRQEAQTRISALHNEGIFTPPSYQGSIMTPGNIGGIQWGGMCYDPVNHLLVTNINRFAAVIRMIPRDSIDAVEKANPEILRAETGRQLGTPYIMKRDYLFKLDNGHILPQSNPPWGTILAIDSRSGRKIWEVPLGYMLSKEAYPDAEKWGSVNFGGAIVTAGNLIFVAATMEGHFRAFDTRTGEKRWDQALPAAGQATPMTYAVNGKQFVVIAAGGHGKLGTRQGDYVVAYALPKHE